MSTTGFALGTIALMFVAGFGIPMMANLNAGLGTRLDSPFAAVAVLSGVIFATSLIVAIVTGHAPNLPDLTHFRTIPSHFFLGGVFFVVYITSITWAAPRIGVANAVFVVLFGQMVSATVIDHFGLFGAMKFEVTPKRVIGLAVMAVGIFLARRDG